MSLAALFFAIALGIAALYFTGVGLFLCYAKLESDKRHKLQERILRNQQSSFKTAISYPIRYSSHRHFHKMLRLFAWEQSGLMFLVNGYAYFVLSGQMDSPLAFDLNSSQITIKWVNRSLYDVLSWFSIEANGETHYFTSETGTFVFTSKEATANIYNRLMQYATKTKSA